MDPLDALNEIAYLLERERSSAYKSKAFRNAAAIVADLDPAILHDPARLKATKGIGDTTYKVIAQALAGQVPEYLLDLRGRDEVKEVAGLTLRGDLHAHTDWSDGTTSIELMAGTARRLGREYLAITDHSPRLTVANGLSPERLRAQIEQIDRANEGLAPFRLLRGIEVDILDDGTLDQEPELLGRLDVVVASVHSRLRMDRAAMTRRMVAAVEQPWTDVLGHCTGRKVRGRERPQSEFDPEVVFAACARHGVAVEVNCQPERQDPPDELIDAAAAAGCLFSIDTDAHAPGELDWLVDGCDRLAARGVPADRVVTTWSVERLLEWSSRRA